MVDGVAFQVGWRTPHALADVVIPRHCPLCMALASLYGAAVFHAVCSTMASLLDDNYLHALQY